MLNVLHYLTLSALIKERIARTRRLKATSSDGMSVSDLPMTGITFTRGERRFMSSMSNSRSLYRQPVVASCKRRTSGPWG